MFVRSFAVVLVVSVFDGWRTQIEMSSLLPEGGREGGRAFLWSDREEIMAP